MMGAWSSAKDREISRPGLRTKKEQAGGVALALHGAAFRDY